MSVQHLSISLVYSLADSCWIAALLWLVFRMLERIFPLQPVHTYRLAAGSVYLVFFVWLIRFLFYAAGGSRFAIPLSVYGVLPSEWTLPSVVMPFLAISYCAGLFYHFIRFVGANRRLNELVEHSFALPESWQVLIMDRANQLGIRRSVIGKGTDRQTSPLTFGWIRPVILFPVALFNQLNYREVESIILHELAHIRRNDYFHQRVFVWMEMVFFFNPFTNDLFRVIRQEREKCCDDMVLETGNQSVDYASALVWCARNAIAFNGGLGAVGREGELMVRVRRITGQPVGRVKSTGFLVPIALCWLLIGTQLNLPISTFRSEAAVKGTRGKHMAVDRSENFLVSGIQAPAVIDKVVVPAKRKVTQKVNGRLGTTRVNVTTERSRETELSAVTPIVSVKTEAIPPTVSMANSLQLIRGLSRHEFRALLQEVINEFNPEEKRMLVRLMNNQYPEQQGNTMQADSAILSIIPGYWIERENAYRQEVLMASKLLLLMGRKWQEKHPKGIELLLHRYPTDSADNKGSTEQ